MAVDNDLSPDQFFALNPGLDCDRIQPGQQVCVGPVARLPPSPPPSPPSPPPDPLPTPPEEVDPLPPANDTCTGITVAIGSGVTTFPQLATQLGVSLAQLTALNKLTMPLAAGARVCIPAKACTTHRVKAGEYLWLIAKKRSTTVEQLVALNPALRGQVSWGPGT